MASAVAKHNLGEQVGGDSARDLQFFPLEPSPRHGRLTVDQIRSFNTNGYCAPIDLFTTDEILHHRRYFDQLAAKAKAEGHDSYAILNWHNLCDGMWDLAYHPRVLDLVEDLIGPDIVCFRAHFFAKHPQSEGDTRQVDWHQDSPYWPLTPSKAVTVWLAIDDVDADNGPMKFVPGSHLHGEIPYEKRSDWKETSVLNLSVREPERWGDGSKIVPALLRAGQVSLHSDLLLHGSSANTSNRRRVGLALSYHPPSVRATVDRRLGFGWLSRGRDEEGYWPAHPDRPKGDRIPRVRRQEKEAGEAKL